MEHSSRINTSPFYSQGHMVDGTVRLFSAELLIVPTGLATVVFLTRRLGPEAYGLFTLATALIIWVEVIISSFFSRATIKFISEAADWRSISTVVIRLHFTVSVGTGLVIFFLADPVAALLDEPLLTTYLRLFSLDIPIFGLASAQRNILIGIGGFRGRSLMSAARWMTRLLLIILLVELGLSVPGAILGSIGASVAELAISCFYVRLSLFRRSSFPLRPLLDYAVPLFLFALSIQLYNRLDLFMLKILGGSAAQAGIYGAAQNLTIIPGIFALSFSPVLLSTLSRMLGAGDDHLSKELGRNAIRVVICLLPFAGMTAGAAGEVIILTFGMPFLSAAPLLSLLIFAALGLVMVSVTTAILTAAGKPGWAFALTGPIVPLAIWGHLLLIPRFGALGASVITTLFAFLGALVTIFAVYRIWNILPPAATVLRSIGISVLAFSLATVWPTPGLLVILKLMLIGLLILLAFLLMGEVHSSEKAFLRLMLHCKPKRE